MRTLLRDAQDLFREATSSTGMKAGELRERSLVLLDTATQRAQEMQAIAVEKGREVAQNTDQYVRQNPWKAVAISTGLGLCVGLLAARRNNA
nr:DUF883 domain-containing protein [Noviherbaspirillum massiliense]